MKFFGFKSFMVILILLAVLSACNSVQSDSEAESESSSDGEANGELKVAITVQPPTLDAHMTTATMTSDIARNIFETLVALNSNYQPVPMLAESIDRSDDGKTYTFHLRENVKFHNDKEMVAEDVVASMNRWVETSMGGKLMEGALFVEGDPHTVLLELEKPIADVLDIMADRAQFPAIMPKEVIESAEADGVAEYIGTGPFKYVDWKQDQYIHLQKFDDYAMVDSPSDGFSGKKEVFVKDVYFELVHDPSTRIAGLKTGEYDIVSEAPNENYEQFVSDDELETYPYHYGSLFVVYNKKEGLSSNDKFRQAINAAINSGDVMKAAYVYEDLYELDSGYMTEDRKDWYSQNGSEEYNQADPERANQLLEEAGYNGETITLLSTRDYEYIYNAAVVLQEELEQIGVNVELEIYDWPTALERRQDPGLWDVHIAGASTPVTPSSLLFLNYDWVGWPEHPKIDELLENIKRSADRDEAKMHWDELQGFVWTDYLPISILGQYRKVIVTSNKVKDFSEFEGGILWNTKLED